MSSFRLFKVQLPSLLAPLPLPVAPFREVLQSACQLWHHGDKRSIFYRLDSHSGQAALWCISIRSKLFCCHREIIKKRSYNIKFHADLVHNRKRHVFHRPVSLEKSELFHHFGHLSSQFWSRNNYDKKKTNISLFKSLALFLDSAWSPTSAKNRRAGEIHASRETRRTRDAKGSVNFAKSFFSRRK